MSNMNELLQPSIEKDWRETKTYDINRLLLVAFIGGPIPLMALGTRNAKWLNVRKLHINLLIILGIILEIGECAVIYLFANGTFSMEDRAMRYLLKLSSILLFLAYRAILTKPFQQHMVTNGTITKILKPAIVWILLGGVVELIVLALGLLG
ncbi:hypothetical protein L1999_27080 [Neobacillus drentensis]|uniref:hypothetical protein n=1 Tax=Neobacillus drentensis TaxID=220684 RepID=UPI001F47CE8C|nr:hypothetical protein [Neobacillus drentensis]ULT56654.1 hypothetical protein L1999_27080 [Neobacillus drentensis]